MGRARGCRSGTRHWNRAVPAPCCTRVVIGRVANLRSWRWRVGEARGQVGGHHLWRKALDGGHQDAGIRDHSGCRRWAAIHSLGDLLMHQVKPVVLGDVPTASRRRQLRAAGQRPMTLFLRGVQSMHVPASNGHLRHSASPWYRSRNFLQITQCSGVTWLIPPIATRGGIAVLSRRYRS